MIGQNGLQLKSMRTSRVRLQVQQEHLNQPTREILQCAKEARREIQAALDENTPFFRKTRRRYQSAADRAPTIEVDGGSIRLIGS